MIKIKTLLTDLTALVKVSNYVLQTFTDDVYRRQGQLTTIYNDWY